MKQSKLKGRQICCNVGLSNLKKDRDYQKNAKPIVRRTRANRRNEKKKNYEKRAKEGLITSFKIKKQFSPTVTLIMTK